MKMVSGFPGTQQQRPISVACAGGTWSGENRQLQPGATAESYLCQQVVPGEASSFPGCSIPKLPDLSQLQQLQLPDLPNCVSKYKICCSTVQTDGSAVLSFPVDEILRAIFHLSASRLSAGKRHIWTTQDRGQSSLTSSIHSCQEMTHQVKAGTRGSSQESLHTMWW